jgi:hypothetical protein
VWLTLKYILHEPIRKQPISNVLVNTISLVLDLRIMTYKTLTAGARLFRGTMPKPAARTAVDWKIPATTRIPAGRSSISLSIRVGKITGRLPALMHNTHGVPISNTMNETKSVELPEEGIYRSG